MVSGSPLVVFDPVRSFLRPCTKTPSSPKRNMNIGDLSSLLCKDNKLRGIKHHETISSKPCNYVSPNYFSTYSSCCHVLGSYNRELLSCHIDSYYVPLSKCSTGSCETWIQMTKSNVTSPFNFLKVHDLFVLLFVLFICF